MKHFGILRRRKYCRAYCNEITNVGSSFSWHLDILLRKNKLRTNTDYIFRPLFLNIRVLPYIIGEGQPSHAKGVVLSNRPLTSLAHLMWSWEPRAMQWRSVANSCVPWRPTHKSFYTGRIFSTSFFFQS